jgi:hypothetical protein
MVGAGNALDNVVVIHNNAIRSMNGLSDLAQGMIPIGLTS